MNSPCSRGTSVVPGWRTWAEHGARDKDSRSVAVRSASGSGMGLTAEPRESVEQG